MSRVVSAGKFGSATGGGGGMVVCVRTSARRAEMRIDSQTLEPQKYSVTGRWQDKQEGEDKWFSGDWKIPVAKREEKNTTKAPKEHMYAYVPISL